MARNLKAFSLALASVLSVGAVAASTATAKHETQPGLFTANVAAKETSLVDAQQVGPATLSLSGGLVLTCQIFLERGKALTQGPSFAQVTLATEYQECHQVVAGITKTVTITMNGCTYISDAKTTVTEPGFDRAAVVTVECPEGKQIELHLYNSASSETTTLCTYDLKPQGPLSGITFTNKVNTPGSVNDVGVESSVSTTITNTTKSALCGQSEVETLVFKSEGTLRATNEKTEFVDASISD
jgi:hypothetical protein